MQKWIALFRGINVGGNNMLPMAKLVIDLEAIGLKNIKTYIQSGNVVFDAESKNAKSLAKAMGARIEQQHRFLPHILLLRSKDLQAAIDANPFPDGVSDPKSLHFFFLQEPSAKPNLKGLDAAKAPSERYLLGDHVFYLHAPDGIGRSKLAAAAERLLGVVTTARNYRTVEKLAALASEL